MSPSNNRATKIKILLVIDSAFFFLELIVGSAVGSLALVADSFHMLNDVCSLVVALQALKLAESTATSSRYSYGWQRAEVLGALINGVFLLALCFSIGLEAITRFFNSVEVTNPKLIVVVGSLGLLSNIVGLFLFHDHGHSHGGHSHSHSHSHTHNDEEASAGTSAPKIKHVHSSSSFRTRSHSHSHGHSHTPKANGSVTDRTPLLSTSTSSTIKPTLSHSNSSTSSLTDTEDESELEEAVEELFVHPGEFRENIYKAAQSVGYGATSGGEGAGLGKRNSVVSVVHSDHGTNNRNRSHSHSHSNHEHSHAHAEEGAGHDHSEHNHDHDHQEEEEESGGHGGHSHDGSMNMRGVFLHVLGDALGNVGVIGAGLFIWLTEYSWRMYSDPFISLIITCIIFSSALPLVKSASFILLQGVPNSVPLDQVRTAISAVPGVLNVHELHIWSLSESKLVASVHIMTEAKDVAHVSKLIRKVMHRFGIHSSTIQPEVIESKPSATPADSLHDAADQDGCPVQCVDESCASNSCCPPPVVVATNPSTPAGSIH